MNNKFVFALGGAFGFGVGILACREYFDRRYREIADAEVASVMEKFGRKKPEGANNDTEPESKPHILKKSVDPRMKQEYQALVKDHGYSNQDEPEHSPTDMDPYVIDPDDFDTIDGYNVVNLTYFADGVLVDEMDLVLSDDDIAGMIGLDSLEHFGDYEDDSVHVRNDLRKTDYEILKDDRTYPDAMRFRPHMEEED